MDIDEEERERLYAKNDYKEIQVELEENERLLNKYANRNIAERYILTADRQTFLGRDFDKMKFPSQNQCLHNDLVEKLLTQKKDIILTQCLKKIINGDKIERLVKGSREADNRLDWLRDGVCIEKLD